MGPCVALALTVYVFAKEDRRLEFLDDLTAAPFVSVPHTRSSNALCTACRRSMPVSTTFDIMENTLNLGVTREHLDVLPVRIVRYVVDYQDQVFTHLGVADGKRQYVCRLECYQWPICLL